MTTMEFGIMDGFADVGRYHTAAEGYDQHIRDAVLAEQLRYRSLLLLRRAPEPA
jgi:hypothetical protein